MISMSKITLFCIKIKVFPWFFYTLFFSHSYFFLPTHFLSISAFPVFFSPNSSILFLMAETFLLIISHSWFALVSLGLTFSPLFFINSCSTSPTFLSFNWSSYVYFGDDEESVWIFISFSVTYLFLNP